MESEPPNPYAAPTVLETVPELAVGELPAGPYGPYRDNRKLSRWLVGLLLVVAFHQLARGTLNLIYTFAPEHRTADTVIMVEKWIGGFGYLHVICMIVFGVWIVRSGKNAWLFAAIQRTNGAHRRPGAGLLPGSGGNPADTPGWAVGWYFIPIANLWKPYLAMRDIVRASSAVRELPHFLLPVWWTLWIVSGISDQFIGVANTNEETWTVVTSSTIWACYSGLDIGLDIVALLLVRGVTGLQTEAAAAYSSGDLASPRRPPGAA